MSTRDLGMPGHSPPRVLGGCRRGGLIALLALFACAMVSILGYLLWPRGPSYTLPDVVIVEPGDGAQLNTGRPLAVLASARSANKITKQELWVDGLQVYVAVARDPQGQNEFVATLLWTPQTGEHTLIARAMDGRGSVGMSDAVRVNVAKSAALPPQNLIQIAAPGDTFNSIAEENAVTPEQIREANPGLADPPPLGEWVNVPPGNNVPQGSDDRPGGDVNDPGAAPLPPDLDAGPAQPAPEFGAPRMFWAFPLPPNLGPLAPDLFFPNVGNCAVTFTWRDNSNDEEGFYLYRLNGGAADFTRIAALEANHAHAALSFTDRDISGDYQYYVAAYNRSGESASRIVPVHIPNQNCWRNLIGQMLEVEAESLTAPGYEELYCYAALKGHRPFERVPMEPGKYLRWMSSPQVPHRPELVGKWNFQEYYGGPNKRIVAAPENGQSFRVEVECYGARVTNEGGEAFSLGSFDQSHPPDEWDGRALTGRGDSFTLFYHIRPWSGPSGAPNAPVDPDIPAPYGLRRVRDLNDCAAHVASAAGLFACALANYTDHPPLVWEWDGIPEQIDGYRIYMNRTPVGGTFVPIVDDWPKDARFWPGPSGIPCGETWRYAITAYNSAGNLVVAESPRSEFIALSGEECNDLALVEVELDDIWVGFIDDGIGDHTAENYGRASFWTLRGGEMADQKGVNLIGPVQMNDTPGPDHFIRKYRWADLPLCHFAGDSTTCIDLMGRNYNKLVFLVREREGLGGRVVIWDSDMLGLIPSGDDIWCRVWFEFPAMSLDEWARFDQVVQGDAPETAYGKCFVNVHVRGLGRASGSRVLAPGGGGPAMTLKNVNLRVVNIERNRQGNVGLTLYNYGPDTLINDAVTLSFQAARVESGVGGDPTAIWEHEERALVTIPAFGQTTIDTGQVLLEGFENRVHVVLTAVNFTDPDLRNNAGCARIDVPDAAHVTIQECDR